MTRTRSSAGRPVQALLGIAGALAIVALPLFFIALAARLVIFSPALYEYGFTRYNIEQRTLIPLDQLLLAAEKTREYFDSPSDEPLSIEVIRESRPFVLYNSREVAHMADVKQLVQGVGRLRDVALLYLVAFMAAGFLLERQAFVGRLSNVLLWGGVLTLVLVVLAGLGSLLDFEALFLEFHMLSFSNDLWQLNPRTDFLLMMYPSEFFRDATLAIGAVTLVLALVSTFAGLLIRPRPQRLPEDVQRSLRDQDPEALLADIDGAVGDLAGWFGSTLYPDEVRVGDWTAQQVLSHLVYWHQLTADGLAVVADGNEPAVQTLDIDGLNEQAVAARMHHTIPELLGDLQSVQVRLKDVTRRLPDPETVVRVRSDGGTRSLRQQLLLVREHLREHLGELRRATMQGAGG